MKRSKLAALAILGMSIGLVGCMKESGKAKPAGTPPPASSDQNGMQNLTPPPAMGQTGMTGTQKMTPPPAMGQTGMTGSTGMMNGTGMTGSTGTMAPSK